MSYPRIALFADSFFEVNGAAQACRQFEGFARRNELPFLTVRCGDTESRECAGRVWTLQLRRGWCAVPIDRDLHFDPWLFRRRHQVLDCILRFRPDIIHITSPGDLGILGAWAAHVARVPLAASWHTNLHEFAGRRIMQLLGCLPVAKRIQNFVEHWILDRILWFFSRASVTFAPNPELVTMLAAHSQRPSFLMTRGIDLTRFTLLRRKPATGPFTIGFVGRLMPEKNLRLLVRLEEQLLAAGAPPFRFLVVGDGSETRWLRANLRNATLTGILSGDELANAYAEMDVFVFPSQTDTFGNVVLEALASGAPAIVSAQGGPKFLVQSGVTGFVADSEHDFINSILALMKAPWLLSKMRVAAADSVRGYSWDRVFEDIYAGYKICLRRKHCAPSVVCTPVPLPYGRGSAPGTVPRP